MIRVSSAQPVEVTQIAAHLTYFYSDDIRLQCRPDTDDIY